MQLPDRKAYHEPACHSKNHWTNSFVLSKFEFVSWDAQQWRTARSLIWADKMPQLIHLTDERLLNRIEKSGIRMTNWGKKIQCVYATPVLKDFQVTHQWLRELKNKGIRTIGAIQFRIPDSEEVLVGRYNEDPLATTAAQAVKVFMEHSTGLGLQILVLRRIEPKEIVRSYVPKQIIGWRYHPDAHGKPPFCGCSYCQRGLIKNRKIREKYEARSPID